MPTGVFGTALHNNEWHICPHVSEEFSDGSGASGNAYRYYTVNLGVTREPTSYVINYMIPTSLLTLLGFVTLLFDGDELGERLGVILTLMLTHSALKIVLSAEVRSPCKYVFICIKYLQLSLCGILLNYQLNITFVSIYFLIGAQDELSHGDRRICDHPLPPHWWDGPRVHFNRSF